MNLKRFFHFYFLTKDFSLNITFPRLKLYRYFLNIVTEGTISQILLLGLSFCFMSKNGIFYFYFLQYIFLDHMYVMVCIGSAMVFV